MAPRARPRPCAHLFTDGSRHGDREGPHIAAAQVFTFPLVAEKLQLPFLFLIQGVAVANLNIHTGMLGVVGVVIFCSRGFLKPWPQTFFLLNTRALGFTVLVVKYHQA